MGRQWNSTRKLAAIVGPAGPQPLCQDGLTEPIEFVPHRCEEKGVVMTRTLDDIRQLARQLRVDAIRCSTAAGSGHPTSSLSAADLMADLMARHLRYDWERPDLPANDHLVFSSHT